MLTFPPRGTIYLKPFFLPQKMLWAPKNFLNNSRGPPAHYLEKNKGFEAIRTRHFGRTFGKIFVTQFLCGTFSVPKIGHTIMWELFRIQSEFIYLQLELCCPPECTAVAAIRLRMRMRILTHPENSLAASEISEKKLRIKRYELIC